MSALFIKNDVLIEVGGEKGIVFRALSQPVARIWHAVYSGFSPSEIL